MRRHLAQPAVQKASVQRAGGATAGDVQRLADQGVRGATAALPHLGRISQAFGPGHDLSGVRARVGGTGAAATQAMGALAYATRGDRVAFASQPSLRMAAHEAAHLIQQKGGVSLPGGVGRAGDAHERHADAVADRVAGGRSAGDLLQQYARPQARSGSQPVQPLSKPRVEPGVQMWKALSKVPWMSAIGQWDTQTDGAGRGELARGKNLVLKPGKVVGLGNNSPSVSPQSWGQLRTWNLTHMRGPPGYLRMHLLCDRLGGAGNTVQNLAPGTNAMNQRHFNAFEKPAINVLNAGGTINSCRIKVTYRTSNGGRATPAGQVAWKDTIRTMRCRARYTDAAGKMKFIHPPPIRETVGIGNKANWVGH